MSNFPDQRRLPATSDPRWMRELDQVTGLGPQKTRSVPVKLLAPLLLLAQQRNSTWLADFQDDVVVIDADLHDVLLAYEKFHMGADENAVADPPVPTAA